MSGSSEKDQPISPSNDKAVETESPTQVSPTPTISHPRQRQEHQKENVGSSTPRSHSPAIIPIPSRRDPLVSSSNNRQSGSPSSSQEISPASTAPLPNKRSPPKKPPSSQEISPASTAPLTSTSKNKQPIQKDDHDEASNGEEMRIEERILKPIKLEFPVTYHHVPPKQMSDDINLQEEASLKHADICEWVGKSRLPGTPTSNKSSPVNPKLQSNSVNGGTKVHKPSTPTKSCPIIPLTATPRTQQHRFGITLTPPNKKFSIENKMQACTLYENSKDPPIIIDTINGTPSTSVKACDRADAFAKFVSNQSQSGPARGTWTWKVILNDDYHFKSQIPPSQTRSLDYFGKVVIGSLRTEMDNDAIKTFNESIQSLIMSIGVATLLDASKKLEVDYPLQLWHPTLIQEFINNLLISLRVGHKIPSYPSPPQKWIDADHAKKIGQSIAADVIFYDDNDLPTNFPAHTSFLLLKDKIRKQVASRPILGHKMIYADLETLLPFDRYELTFNTTVVIIQILCSRSQPGREQEENALTNQYTKSKGLRYISFDDLDMQDAQDVGQGPLKSNQTPSSSSSSSSSSLTYQQKQKETITKEFVNYNKDYDFVTLVNFKPFRKNALYEVLAFIKFTEKKIHVYTPKQPKCGIGQFHPFAGQKQIVQPSELMTKLNNLRFLLSDLFHDQVNEWILVPEFITSKSMDILPDGKENYNRLLLCKFVDFLIAKSGGSSIIPWMVAKERPLQTQAAQQLLVPNLNSYIENFLYYTNGTDEEEMEIPSSVLMKMFTKDSLEWAWPYLKLRYWDLIRDYMKKGK